MSDEIRVEKGIPLPCNGRKASPAFPGLKETLLKMEIEDSIFMSSADPSVTAKIRNVVNGVKYRQNRGFTTRIMEGGLRIWRTR